jgi:hypothetical protein
MMWNDKDYITLGQVTHIRIWWDGAHWNVDGVDDEGGYTETCWRFNLFSDARKGAEEFRTYWELPDRIPVTVTDKGDTPAWRVLEQLNTILARTTEI